MYKLFAAEGETHGNFVIYGGTYGVDYEYVTGTSPISVQGYGSNESYNTTQNTPKSGGVLSQAMDYLSIKHPHRLPFQRTVQARRALLSMPVCMLIRPLIMLI